MPLWRGPSGAQTDVNQARTAGAAVVVDPLTGAFLKHRDSVMGLETTDASGDPAMGTAFHVGDGYFITARHVVEDRSITAVVPPRSGQIREVYSVRYPSDVQVDLALLSSDFTGGTAVELGGHLDDWIDDGLMLSKVVLLGFPRVPFAAAPVLVAATGDVSAVLDRYDRRGVHFVISSVPRGGFSGGPVIHEGDWLLGVLVEELSSQTEAPFAAVLSVEPIYALLEQVSVAPRANRQACFICGVWENGYPEAFTSVMSDEELADFEHWRDNITTVPDPVSVGDRTPPIIDGPSLWIA